LGELDWGCRRRVVKIENVVIAGRGRNKFNNFILI
jgi:hypothetical protein